ncbi:TnsD family Tn7-like transposition protein [Roseateles noduli]|uniref:TnsD family Tn7-like transposition protein n=1 Tax=Roseateles noduli TaxID=2052484 RepID=UPI003D66047E
MQLTASAESLLFGGRNLLNELGALLQSRGLVTSKGSIRRKALVTHLVQFSQGRFEHPELDNLLSTHAKAEALLAPLWNGRGTLHPSVAAILISALEALEPTSQPSLWEPRRDIRSPELDAALANGQRPTQAAGSFGISVQSAIQRAMELGIPVGRRPKVLTSELTKQVKSQLRAGLAVGAVARSTGLSQSTVYRILSASTELKVAWTSRLSQRFGDELTFRRERFAALVQGHPEMGAKDLRGLAPADYAYLYRVDRDWLKELMPAPIARGKSKPPRSRAPQGADDALAEKVSRASAQTKYAPAPKQTVTAVMHNAGRTFAHVPTGGMPKTAAALSAATESLRTYVFRRLLWTVRRLRHEGRWAPDWQVKKESRLRAEIIDAAGVQVSEVVARAEVLRMQELLHEA